MKRIQSRYFPAHQLFHWLKKRHSPQRNLNCFTVCVLQWLMFRSTTENPQAGSYRAWGTVASSHRTTCSSRPQSHWSWGSLRTPTRPPWPWDGTGKWWRSPRTCPAWPRCSPPPSCTSNKEEDSSHTVQMYNIGCTSFSPLAAIKEFQKCSFEYWIFLITTVVGAVELRTETLGGRSERRQQQGPLVLHEAVQCL